MKIDLTLQRLGLTPAAVKRVVMVTATSDEGPRRAIAVMAKQRYGRKGLPRCVTDQMFADYKRLGSIAAVAPLYGRSPQSIWETLHSNGYPLKPGSKARIKPGSVTVGGVLYSPSGKGGDLRGTVGARKFLKVVIWEQANGRLPRGWEIAFRNGDKLDCRLENMFAGPKAEVSRFHQKRLHPGSANLTAEQNRARWKKHNLDRYHARAEQFKAKGLRCDGKPMRRKILTEAERAERTQARNRDKWRNRAARHAAEGLTSRGAPPAHRRRKLSPSAELFAQLKAEIDQQAAGGQVELPIATGFRNEAGVARGGGNGRGFMQNLISRGTDKQKEAA
jgi:hypothetical protein